MFKLTHITQAGIALAYAQAPTFDARAITSWRALAEHSRILAARIRKRLVVVETSNPEPYATAGEMFGDIRNGGKLIVSTANSEHPLFSLVENVDFRLVHDYMGHYAAGSDFSWEGEVEACREHARDMPIEALPALFTECLGQAAYATYRNQGYDANFKQKVAFLEVA